mgnify:CR=1 FL=1
MFLSICACVLALSNLLMAVILVISMRRIEEAVDIAVKALANERPAIDLNQEYQKKKNRLDKKCTLDSK